MAADHGGAAGLNRIISTIRAALGYIERRVTGFATHLLGRPHRRPAPGPIKHVFVLVLENRSFDHMLGQLAPYTGRDAVTGDATTLDGPPPDAANTYQGRTYPVSAGAPFVMPADPPHEFADVQTQLADDMGGFAASYATQDPATPGQVLRGFTPEQLPVLGTLAREFAVCDRWFSAVPGPTWPNRFFLHAATSGGRRNSPPTPRMATSYLDGFDFPNGTIFDSLDRANLLWRVYHGDPFPQVLSLKGMDEKLLAGYFHSLTDFAADVADPGFLPSYVFVEPDYGHVLTHDKDFQCGNSQHPDDDVTAGEQLIKDVYEAVRKSPHWPESLLVITYDEHGGFYDHVPPPDATPPGDTESEGFDFARLGVRVPAVAVSPLIAAGTIDHTGYDHTSVLATLERLWGLPPLTRRDAAAADLRHLLTLNEPRDDAPERLPAPPDSGFRCPGQPAHPHRPVARGAPATLSEAELDAAGQLDSRPISQALTGFLQAAARRDASTSPPDQRARIAQQMTRVQTHGQAQLYLQKVTDKVSGTAD